MSKEESNKLIAEFMGVKPYEDSRYGTLYTSPVDGRTTCFDLMYHSSWEWLMPVVEKLEQDNYGFKMCRKVVEIYYDNTKETIYTTKKSSRIESLYDAVVWFVIRHNNIQNQSGSSLNPHHQ